MTPASPLQDPLGAFVPGPRHTLPPNRPGPLSGLEFAVKDIFDTEGLVTGCGNPDWAASHAPAKQHAWAVQALLDAGASLVGKTITDELAYSLNGQNFHYGTPANVNAPSRIPGGSSCGSAAAVAGGLCDTALGSDTGGSVRIPGSYCGVFGLRPTHGRIPLTGVMPLAPSFDTVGWFARDAETLRRVGEVLLGPDPAPMAFERLLIATDAFALAEPPARAALEPEVALLRARLGGGEDFEAGAPGGGLGEWMQRFRTIQAREISAVHGDWIAAQNPRFGPDIAERFAWARTIGEAEAQAASAARAKFAERLSASLAPGRLLAIPTAPNIAPLCAASAEALGGHRLHVLSLTSIAGLSGLPQVTLPLARVSGCPLGLSLIGPAGSDASLLAFAEDFASGPGRD